MTRQAVAYASLAKALKKRLAEAKVADDYAAELVRVSLMLGKITAFASYPTKRVAFAIDKLF